jgi:hypothetical protein
MPADQVPDPVPTVWIDATAAAKILEIPDRHNVPRIVAEGLITTRSLPHVRARYLRADVERLAKESVKPSWTHPPDLI